MIPIKNKKKSLEVTVEEMTNFALNYVEKFAPSKQQLKTYLLKKYLTSKNANIKKTDVSNLIDIVLEDLEKSKFINDKFYSESKAKSLIQRGSSINKIRNYLINKGVGEKYKLGARLKLAYIANEQGLDFYNTYPFYIDCKEVLCTRPQLDEMPVWYYVTTEKSGEPIYMYPYDDHAGYLRGSLAVGMEALYFSGSTPYNVN